MATQQYNGFQRIDAALAGYYQNLGYSDYTNPQTGIGRFMQYIFDEELNDEELPIDKELGDNCDPNDCAYSWMNNDTEFPIPSYVNITNNQQKEAFIFYVLQYCYKHAQPPSEQYIRSTLIVPQSGATLRNNQQVNDNQSPPMITKQGSIYTQAQRAPVPFSQGTMFDHPAFSSDPSSKSNHVYTKQLTQANLLKLPAIDDLIGSKTVEPLDENAEAVPQQIINGGVSTIEPEIVRVADIEFIPKYPSQHPFGQFSKQVTSNQNDNDFNTKPIGVEMYYWLNDDKYQYRLETLRSKEQIRNDYAINANHLSKKSRKNQDFTNKLLLKKPGSVSQGQMEAHHVYQVNHLRNEVITYKKAFGAEQLRSHHLQQSMQHNAQMYITEINQLKQQHQAFVAPEQFDFVAKFLNIPRCIRDLINSIEFNLDPNLMMAAELMEIPKDIRDYILSIQIDLDPGVYSYVPNNNN